MASLRKNKSSAFWYACITLPDGKRKQFSTGLTDKAEALEVAVSTERAFHRATAAPSNLHTRLTRIADDVAPVQSIDPATWLRAWVKTRAREVKTKTLSSYETNIEAIATALEAAKVKSFLSLTPAIIQKLRDDLTTTHAPSTINLRIHILRLALHAAVRENLIAVNPARDVKKLTAPRSNRREFRPAEIETLLSHVTGEWRVLVLLGLYTGQRLNDLATRQWRHIDLAEAIIRFYATKTGDLVCLPIVSPLLEALTALPTSDDLDAYVLPGIAATNDKTRSNQFMKILHDCGLVTRTRKTKAEGPLHRLSPISFHSLRHTTSSYLKAAGVSDAIARAIVGHKTVAISDHYTHIDMETLRGAMAKLSFK